MKSRPLIRTVAPILAAFLGGYLAQSAVSAAVRNTTYDKLGIFTRVLTYVENNYVEEVDATGLVYGAIKGMMGTLDPHSVFMTPAEYEDMKVDTNGEFGGIGLEVTRQGDGLVVVTPIDDTPASRAGLQSGDQILTIDGAVTSEMELGDAVRRMRGAPGSKVILNVMREGFAAARDFTLVRDQIRVNPVEWKLVDGYGVIRIKSFQDRTDRYLRNALRELRKSRDGELPGVVLDLRNNPGGLLDQAVTVADTFLSEGLIVSTRGRGAHAEMQRAHRGGTEPKYPLVVLVNGGSASASEIVAGALQDHGRGVIMGTRTFGKGSVQTVIDLDDGSGLKLTIARYYTPKGRSIQELGITPDVLVQDLKGAAASEEVTREKDLQGHLPPETTTDDKASADTPEDFQLKTALDALKSWQIFRAGLETAETTRSAAR